MFTLRRAGGCSILLALVLLAAAPMRVQGGQPLTEENLTKLIELQIEDETIAAKLRKEGIGFAVDDDAIGRLKKAGASDALIESARAVFKTRAPVPAGKAITYQDVLKLFQLGLEEKDILKRLERSPTLFTLDAGQVEELKPAGATEALLSVMQPVQGHTPPAAMVAKLAAFAIVLDCSGSMGEQTRDGHIKMDVAKRFISDLVARMPEKLRVTFVIYGYDRELNCRAVQVARPLGALDVSGKSELAAMIAGLRPIGGTPIALALEVAGRELGKDDLPGGLVLLSDGKETCGGNPAEVAARLVGQLKLTYGVNVIGFDVDEDERASLAGIARAGKGRYYNAQSAFELDQVVKALRKQLPIEGPAPPPPAAGRITLKPGRNVQVYPPAIQLPPMETIYLTAAGVDSMALRVDHIASIGKYGQVLRIPPTAKAERFDLWWVPQQGRAVRMIKELKVDDSTTSVHPEQYLGLLRVNGENLPAASLVLLTPVGTSNLATRVVAAQSAAGYGKDLVVAAGQYDLWIEPSNGGKSECLAEKVTVEAGRVTVIE